MLCNVICYGSLHFFLIRGHFRFSCLTTRTKRRDGAYSLLFFFQSCSDRKAPAPPSPLNPLIVSADELLFCRIGRRSSIIAYLKSVAFNFSLTLSTFSHKTHSSPPVQRVNTSFRAAKPLQRSRLNVGCLETTQSLAPNWSERVPHPAAARTATLLCKLRIMRQSEFQITSGTLEGEWAAQGPVGTCELRVDR